jgi:hypothetical protein
MLSRMSDERREAMLFDYLADALEPSARADFEAYVDATPAWRDRLERERRLEANLRALSAPSPPSGFAERAKANARKKIEEAQLQARLEETAERTLRANAKRPGRGAKVVSLDDLSRLADDAEEPLDNGKSYPGERTSRVRLLPTLGWAAAVLLMLVYFAILSVPQNEKLGGSKFFGGKQSQVATSTQKLVGAIEHDAALDDLGAKGERARPNLFAPPAGNARSPEARAEARIATASKADADVVNAPAPPAAAPSPFQEPALDDYGGGGVNHPRFQVAVEEESARANKMDAGESLPEEWFEAPEASASREIAMADSPKREGRAGESGSMEQQEAVEDRRKGKEGARLEQDLRFEPVLPPSAPSIAEPKTEKKPNADRAAGDTSLFFADSETAIEDASATRSRDTLSLALAPDPAASDEKDADDKDAAGDVMIPKQAEEKNRELRKLTGGLEHDGAVSAAALAQTGAKDPALGYSLALETFERTLAENGMRLLDRETLPDGRVRLIVAGQEEQLATSLAPPLSLGRQFAAVPAPGVAPEFAQSGLPTVVWNPRDRYATLNDANELLAMRGDGSESLPTMQNSMFQAAMTLEEMPILSVDWEWQPLAVADFEGAPVGDAYYGAFDGNAKALPAPSAPSGRSGAGQGGAASPANAQNAVGGDSRDRGAAGYGSPAEPGPPERVYALTIRPLGAVSGSFAAGDAATAGIDNQQTSPTSALAPAEIVPPRFETPAKR